MHEQGWFVTATDTDAGKTFVTAGLLRHFLGRGLNALSVKPVQTGCAAGPDGVLSAPDVEYCIAAAGSLLPDGARQRMVCDMYPQACSPHLAANWAGTEPDLATLAAHVCGLGHWPVIVEGAGGVFAPLSDRATMADLMARLSLPVLVVADNRLGAINQTLLTLGALEARNLSVAGIVMTHCTPVGNDGPEGEAIRQDNVQTIERLGGARVFADIPHQPRFDPASLEAWSRVDEHFSRIAANLLTTHNQ